MVIAHPNDINNEHLKINWTEQIGSWACGLQDLIAGDYMDDLMNFVEQQYNTDYGTYPLNKNDVFKAFRLCEELDTKVVIIGSEPYPSPKSNGLAYGASYYSKDLPPNTQAMINCVRNTIYNDSGNIMIDHTLHDWATQGVLLLNASLTSELSRSHEIYWRNFTRSVIKYISDNHANVVFMFPDGTCNYFKKYINTRKHKLLENKGLKLYIDCDIFLEADKYLYTYYKETIQW